VFGGDSLQIDYISILAFFKKKNPHITAHQEKKKTIQQKKKNLYRKEKKS